MRAEIESSDYKKYIFAMIFLKRLSDQFEAEQEKIKKANSDKPEKVLLKKLNDKDNYTYYVPEQARWKITLPQKSRHAY
jgi:type I restriction enzyme M protein